MSSALRGAQSGADGPGLHARTVGARQAAASGHDEARDLAERTGGRLWLQLVVDDTISGGARCRRGAAERSA